MRHNMARRKLGRNTPHRVAMLRNMATSLFRHEKISTTLQKAKELRPFAEKLITLAKKETLQARRQVLRHIHDKEIVSKLFDTIGVRFATRPGGYTRIIKTNFRRGDNAEMAIIELVSSDVTSVKKAAPAKRKASKKPVEKASPVKEEAKAKEEQVQEEKATGEPGDVLPPEEKDKAAKAQEQKAEQDNAPVDVNQATDEEIDEVSDENQRN